MTTKVDESRLKELEAIEAKKAKMPKHKLQNVRIDYHTIIQIRVERDPILAAENFRRKIDSKYKKELSEK